MLGRRRNTPAVRGVSGKESHPGARSDGSLSTGTGSEIERLRGMIAQLMHTADHDPLTGLPTRSLLLERLEHELARDAADGAGIAILFVDLDNFKLVNDSLGHGSGDEVLSEMAKRVIACIGSEDIASRFGGDEIVVLHSRATAAFMSSPLRGKYRARFHRPTFSNTAPRSCAQRWVGVVRTGSNRSPREMPAMLPKVTGV